MRVRIQSFAMSPVAIACAALAFRIALLYLSWHTGKVPDASGRYGYEAGRIAESIATGKGFSSPSPLVETGPTAWLSPVYPYLVAGVFKLWGIYTAKSHAILQLLNCFFPAATILPIFAIAKRSLGGGVAVLSSWTWVFLPTAWHMPMQYVWDTTLSALWFALLFWATLAIRQRSELAAWAGYGALWAIGAMINASCLSVFPFFIVWLAWESQKRQVPWLPQVSSALVVFLLGLMPWTIRNYRAFGRLIPVRNNVGIMLWHGNNSIAPGLDSFAMAPYLYRPEADLYKRLGEVSYMQMKQREAIRFMRSHPSETVRLILGRLGRHWFFVTDRPNTTWSAEPLYIRIYSFLNGLLILCCWFGAVMMLRERDSQAIPYAIVLLFYPLVYYVTASLLRYRFPIDPLLTILAVHGASALQTWRHADNPMAADAIGGNAIALAPLMRSNRDKQRIARSA
jgi:4-amino-4-deoxy-L-arabinose transferase-like glycosyltransferase